VIAVRERRGAFPTEALLKMSLAGDVSIEDVLLSLNASRARCIVDMLRPAWLIFAGRRRDSPVKLVFRELFHRVLALIGLIVFDAGCDSYHGIDQLESRGPIFYKQERVWQNGRIFSVIKFAHENRRPKPMASRFWAVSNDERVTRIGKINPKIEDRRDFLSSGYP